MNSFWKDIGREIKRGMARFISLLVITALGAMSVVGIQATAIDMRDIADKTYKSAGLYDIQLKSTTGFNADDAGALRGTAETVMPTYIFDVYTDVRGELSAVRMFALPDELNKVTLLDGRLPENARECAVERRFLREGGCQIGDSVSLSLDDMDDYYKVLNYENFTITGVVSSPLYISHGRGRTSLGNGSLRFYAYLHPDAYAPEVYTDVYLVMPGSRDIYNVSDEYNHKAEAWKEAIEQIGNARVEILKNELRDAQAEIDDGWAEYHDGLRELEENLADARAELAVAWEKLEDAKKELADGQETLDAARAELEGNLAALQAIAPQGVSPDIDARYGQVLAGMAMLDAQQSEIDGGWAEFNQGLEDYRDGAATLETEESDARETLADAKAELTDAQSKIDDAPEPEWFYFTRKDGESFDSYYQDTMRLQKIGYVFPMVFFIVAMLVSLTTMSRMVEEHRTQIGVYKALGYRPAAIMLKYAVYTLAYGFLGGILGVVAGSVAFPKIITDAYGHLYFMPPVETPVPMGIAAFAVLASVVSVLAVTLFTCASAMNGEAAMLMRPKAPKAGKRVLIERIPFIWNRFGFIGKVTARNIFRYKKRFLMTLAGVAGCSALLLTAFGLRDSLGSVTELQYSEIVLYDAMAYVKEVKTVAQRDALNAVTPNTRLYIREESVSAKTENGGMAASLIVPEDGNALGGFIKLGDGYHGGLPEDGGVFVTEKLAREMRVSEGDEFTLTDSGGAPYTVRAEQIVENYILHYVYMSVGTYAELFGHAPLPNALLIRGEFDAGPLMKNGGVRAFVNTSELASNMSDSTDAMGVVTVVLIVLACALAFVVLFNLTAINVTERTRELATVKVLGFQDSETALYIYRENTALTVIGIALGLVGGIFLEGFVLTSVEIDLLKFPHVIHTASFVLSAVLSVVFAMFVNAAMYRKLAAIDMVESLKNVE